MYISLNERPAVGQKRSRSAAPRVTIIIPSYNHERFVAGAIESAFAQTYQDFEIIITDDASTDSSVDVLSAYARTDSRITLFLNRFNYETHATNHCIQHASGEYIAVLSSDDEFYPTKLEKQVDFLDRHPEFAAVFTQARIIDDEGRDFPDPSHFYCTIFQQPNRSRHEWLRHFFFKGNCLCHPSVLIRRSVYDTLGGYNPLMGALDDLDMWVRVCLHHEIHILPNTLVNFRLRGSHANVSADTPENFRRVQYETIKILDHFQSPQALAQLHLIFPELANEVLNEADDVKRHVLAMAALKSGGLAHRFWAIDLLYQLLSDPEAKQRLHHRIGAAPDVDFIKLNGALNPFAVEHRPSAQVFWPEGSAFSEVSSQSRYFPRSQWTELRFPLPTWDSAMPLRFDPCDCIGVVKMSGLKIVSRSDGRCLWSCVLNARETVTLGGTAAWLSSDRHAISILSTGDDPQMYLLGIPPMPDLPLEVRVWIKLEPVLTSVAEEIESLKARLQQLECQVEALNHAAMERDAELIRLTGEGRKLEALASEREAELTRLTAEGRKLEALASERDAELTRLTAEGRKLEALASERDAELTRLTVEGRMLEALAAERDATARALEEAVERLKTDVTEFEARMVRLSAENTSLKATVAERDHVANMVLSSRSWRYTRPLRSLRRVFGPRGPAENPEG
jgi:GT2 family glycosyltransferase